jgi:hypothetical protein
MQCGRHGRALKDCVLETPNFSVCRKFILARNTKDVEVLPIPEKMLASTARGCITDRHTAELGTVSKPELPEYPSNTLELFTSQLRPGTVLSGPFLVPYDKSSNASTMKVLVVTNSNNELKLESIGAPDHLQLLTLPQSFDVSNTATNLRLPRSSSDPLKIIFNKTASEEYSLSDGKEGQFPKIVDRDVNRSIARVFGPTTAETTGEY